MSPRIRSILTHGFAFAVGAGILVILVETGLFRGTGERETIPVPGAGKGSEGKNGYEGGDGPRGKGPGPAAAPSKSGGSGGAVERAPAGRRRPVRRIPVPQPRAWKSPGWFTDEKGGTFFKAIRSGDLEGIRKFLEAGADPGVLLGGETALHVAVQTGSVEVLELLIARAGRVDVPDRLSRSPLHYAAEGVDLPRMAERLVRAGADPNRADKLGWTPLALAMIKGNPSIERSLRAKGGRIPEQIAADVDLLVACRFGDAKAVAEAFRRGGRIDARYSSGDWALYALLERDDETLLGALLDAGLNPKWKSADGFTLVHAAADVGKAAPLTLLLARGAPADLRDEDGWTPLHCAANEGSEPAVAILLEAGADPNVVERDGETALTLAIDVNEDVGGIVKRLLAAGADANLGRCEKRPPLHLALAQGDDPAVIRLLLEAGADVKTEDGTGNRPIHYAVQEGEEAEACLQICRWLLARGADPNGWDADGSLSLEVAAGDGSGALIALLLDKGADPNGKDRLGRTVLHECTNQVPYEQEDVTVVARLLLDRGADPNLADSTGQTPLHTAAQGGHVEICRLFLERGAEPNAQDHDGWTPLHEAARRGEEEIVRMLLEKGSDPALRDVDGDTPLDLARKKGYGRVTKILEAAMGK
ncbi:MAG: ankyrin repeat domain-containing protein [Planctomycetota bacterium]|jgi:ankyrin repeat protein